MAARLLLYCTVRTGNVPRINNAPLFERHQLSSVRQPNREHFLQPQRLWFPPLSADPETEV